MRCFAQITDFVPVAGSAADGQVGAFRRIRALPQGDDRTADVLLPPFSLLLEDWPGQKAGFGV